MSHFFPCYPKTLYVQTWPIIWFDDISNLSDSIINECELDCRMRFKSNAEKGKQITKEFLSLCGVDAMCTINDNPNGKEPVV
ncbi:hypothetical protein LINPERHAP2_LOCUS35852 [Linum perenne]